jgi:uncharacterized protein (AIM24 family)
MASYCNEFEAATTHWWDDSSLHIDETVVKIEVKNGEDVVVEKYAWSTVKRDLAMVVGKARKEKKRGLVTGYLKQFGN